MDERRLESIEERLKNARSRILTLEARVEVILSLLRNIYILTKPITAINQARLEQWILDLKNEAPDDNSGTSPYEEDQLRLRYAREYEDIVKELIEYLEPKPA